MTETATRPFAIDRSILYALQEGILICDSSGALRLLNPSAQSMFGWSEEEAVGRPVAELFEAIPSAPGSHEIVATRKDGSEVPVEVVVSNLEVEGEPWCIVSARDVSGRRQIELERDRFFTLSLEMLCVATMDGFFKRINPAFEHVLGYTQKELMSRPFLEFVHPDDVDSTLAEVASLREGRSTVLFTNRYRASDGTYRLLQWSTSPDPELQLLFAAARDITEARAREVELARKNHDLEVSSRVDRVSAKILYELGDPTAEREGFRGVLGVLADEAQYRPVGLYLFDEWMGNLVLEASVGLPSSFEGVPVEIGSGFVGEAAKRGKPVILTGEELERIAADPEGVCEKPAAMFAWPLSHEGQLLGVLCGGSRNDLGERERSWLSQFAAQLSVGLYAQRQYLQLKEVSEQLIERTRRVAAQNAELDRSNRLKSQFLANMSHELRTPLNAIIGFSEVLKDGLVGELAEQQADYVEEIFESGQHLLALINDILDLSKIEAGKLEFEVERTNIEVVLRNAISVVQERAARGGVELTLTLDPKLDDFYADGRRVRQIAYNLLANAVKFTQPGGRVDVIARKEDTFVAIDVRDSGLGIAPENHERVFHPFEQIEAGIDRRFEGSGLGLALVRRFCELHGGSVELKSDVGQGSTFTVRLPLRGEPRSKSHAAAVRDQETSETHQRAAWTPPLSKGRRPGMASLLAQLRRDGRPGRILVVDDDPRAVKLITSFFADQPFDIASAFGGMDAVTLASIYRPDIILLDLMMPDTSGFDVIEALSQEATTASIPIIVLTARTLAKDELERLGTRVARVCRKSQSTREEIVNAVHETLAFSTDRSPGAVAR